MDARLKPGHTLTSGDKVEQNCDKERCTDDGRSDKVVYDGRILNCGDGGRELANESGSAADTLPSLLLPSADSPKLPGYFVRMR